jgi:hypothetical protein
MAQEEGALHAMSRLDHQLPAIPASLPRYDLCRVCSSSTMMIGASIRWQGQRRLQLSDFGLWVPQ